MRKLIIIGCIAAMFVSCSKNNDEQRKLWEYKIVKIDGKEPEKLADRKPRTFDDQTPMLNKMGKEGWELVNVYTEDETVFADLSNEHLKLYMRGNCRTHNINYVFKRQVDSNNTPKQ